MLGGEIDPYDPLDPLNISAGRSCALPSELPFSGVARLEQNSIGPAEMLFVARKRPLTMEPCVLLYTR